jgi:nitrate/nitrite transport system ATP-binding protein
MMGRQLVTRQSPPLEGRDSVAKESGAHAVALAPVEADAEPAEGPRSSDAQRKPYVRIKDVELRVTGRDGKSWNVLEDVQLDIAEGEFVSVIGHSGCGKSTLLRLVAGLDFVTGGEIRVGSEVVRGPGEGRMVVFQNHSLLPWLTLRKNVALAVDHVHAKKSKAERKEIIDQHLAMVHLTQAADRLPHQVSGGMKQRCGIARAFSTRPRLLLMDEPFGALDALTRAKLQDQVLRIWEQDRTTVMMITHDVDEALLLSDRIVLMSNGPRARVADVMTVELGRPRERTTVIDQPSYYRQRSELLYFLNKCKREKAGPAKAKSAEKRPTAQSPAGTARGLEKTELVVGFVPLLDCAPFAVAEAESLFAERGLSVTLSREPSWKAVVEGLREGRLDAAQVVAGMPLAETLGLKGRSPFALCTALTLSRGGNAITFGKALSDAGVKDRATLKTFVRERKAAGGAPLIFGMTHPASMHNLLLRAWLASGGIDPDLDLTLTAIPPPQMVANLQQGNIAGYCVGEPWNVRSARDGHGVVCVTDNDIWPDHPEKVLAVSAAWAEQHPHTHVALVESLLAACARCDEPDYRRTRLPELLARPEYVGATEQDLAACLAGPYPYGDGRVESAPDFVHFGSGPTGKHRGNVCAPSEALWILSELARWQLVSFPEDPSELLGRVYLGGVLDQAAERLGVALPASELSPLTLLDGPTFDPRAPLEYLKALAIRRELKVVPLAPRAAQNRTRPEVAVSLAAGVSS